MVSKHFITETIMRYREKLENEYIDLRVQRRFGEASAKAKAIAEDLEKQARGWREIESDMLQRNARQASAVTESSDDTDGTQDWNERADKEAAEGNPSGAGNSNCGFAKNAGQPN